MQLKPWHVGAGALALLLIAGLGAIGTDGWSLAAAIGIFSDLAVAAALVLLVFGLLSQSRILQAQREELRLQRDQMARIVRGMGRPEGVDRSASAPLGSDEPRLFLKMEHSLGDSSIVVILKNNGAQIWGVSLYWHDQGRTHFIDQTHPTLETGEEIIAFIAHSPLPEQFDVIATYTKRNLREQEERWSIHVDSAGFDCVYEGKIEGGLNYAGNTAA